MRAPGAGPHGRGPLSNQAIGERLYLSPKTVEAHVHSIFTRLDLHAAPDDHRRVLAVLAFLRA